MRFLGQRSKESPESLLKKSFDNVCLAEFFLLLAGFFLPSFFDWQCETQCKSNQQTLV